MFRYEILLRTVQDRCADENHLGFWYEFNGAQESREGCRRIEGIGRSRKIRKKMIEHSDSHPCMELLSSRDIHFSKEQ